MSTFEVQDSSAEAPQVLPLGVVGRVLLHNWLVLLLCFVIGGVGGYFIAKVVPPTYSATATQLVKGIPGTGVAANYEAAQFAVSRARSYPSFIYSQDVLEGVASDMGTTDTTAIRNSLSATNPTDTPLVQITATARTAQEAKAKANFAAARMASFITRIETVAGKAPISVETAVQALLPEEPSDPRPSVYAAVGAALGLAIGIVIAIARYFSRLRGGGRPVRRRRKPRGPKPSEDGAQPPLPVEEPESQEEAEDPAGDPLPAEEPELPLHEDPEQAAADLDPTHIPQAAEANTAGHQPPVVDLGTACLEDEAVISGIDAHRPLDLDVAVPDAKPDKVPPPFELGRTRGGQGRRQETVDLSTAIPEDDLAGGATADEPPAAPAKRPVRRRNQPRTPRPSVTDSV